MCLTSLRRLRRTFSIGVSNATCQGLRALWDSWASEESSEGKISGSKPRGDLEPKIERSLPSEIKQQLRAAEATTEAASGSAELMIIKKFKSDKIFRGSLKRSLSHLPQISLSCVPNLTISS
jgi:hypothetical protein